MKKTIFFWLYFIASIILAVYFSVRIITSIMGRGPVSDIKHISILSDQPLEEHERVLDQLRSIMCLYHEFMR